MNDIVSIITIIIYCKEQFLNTLHVLLALGGPLTRVLKKVNLYTHGFSKNLYGLMS